ncbi:MAG TPA: PIG-L family deacetylase, partial [Kofleriaceae bacterium]|nr:PIG-L family deacetylase [Kofleriaceae bacterium]
MRALLGLAIAAACTSRAHDPAPAPAEGGPSDHRTPCDGAGAPCNDVYVVAHPDDDLLFMNPDIENSIATGNNVTVVVLTAGDVYVDDLAKDCGKPSHDDPEVYWRDRERGMLNAYAHMARKQAFDAYVEGNAVPPDWRRIADPGHTGMSVDGLELAGYQLELGSCGHVGCERQKVRVIFFRFADIQLQCLWNNTPGCLGGGYHPEIAKPAELEWARGSCAHHDELSCTGDADCPAGDTCANLPQQVAGTCAKHPDTACYSSWGCPSGDTCANASCAGCVVRTGTYYAYTLGCATTATRTCSGTSACVFPGDGGDRCCTACTTTPASDQCPLGTEIPEQKVVGRDQLIRILAALFTRLEADSVSTLDASNLNFDVLGDPDGSGYHEFWTHYYTGLFTLAALADAQATTTTHIAPRMYRDYTVDQEPQNLSFSGAQQLQKRQTFARYFLFDDKSRLASGTIDDPKFGARDYDVGYEYRMYAARALVGTRELHGRLRVATGGCLLGDAT